jgi:hypothetical protein
MADPRLLRSALQRNLTDPERNQPFLSDHIQKSLLHQSGAAGIFLILFLKKQAFYADLSVHPELSPCFPRALRHQG